MAKGVEDTAFYRYGRLLALNDVGGDPSRFGIAVDRFHAGSLERAERFPLDLLTTQTHDAKRSADVRARIGALSSMPEEWVSARRAVVRAHRAAGARAARPTTSSATSCSRRSSAPGRSSPTGSRRTWRRRCARPSATRNWIEPNAEWEEAVSGSAARSYADDAFLADFEPFAARWRARASAAALGQLVLKLTAPGVPDIYQGDELAFRALVDPDNRRPVDWRLAPGDAATADGRRRRPVGETRKLFVTLRLLGLRARRPEPFAGRVRAARRGPIGVRVRARRRRARGGGASGPGRSRARSRGPGGRWRDVLRGDERSFDARMRVPDVAGELGLAVFERL